jgi:hypothetical protein
VVKWAEARAVGNAKRWNTAYLERAATTLRNNSLLHDDALQSFLSPLGWEHINLTGDYLWRHSSKVGAEKFRPLRSATRA